MRHCSSSVAIQVCSKQRVCSAVSGFEVASVAENVTDVHTVKVFEKGHAAVSYKTVCA
jgi:hypothetical protein